MTNKEYQDSCQALLDATAELKKLIDLKIAEEEKRLAEEKKQSDTLTEKE